MSVRFQQEAPPIQLGNSTMFEAKSSWRRHLKHLLGRPLIKHIKRFMAITRVNVQWCVEMLFAHIFFAYLYIVLLNGMTSTVSISVLLREQLSAFRLILVKID